MLVEISQPSTEKARSQGILDLDCCGDLDTLRREAELDGSLEDVFLKLTEEAAKEGVV